uniref:Secreted protein n=1 Tax=Plectus sambesii TaxID=2011161 RepID=A0A914W9T7_9BILA
MLCVFPLCFGWFAPPHSPAAAPEDGRSSITLLIVSLFQPPSLLSYGVYGGRRSPLPDSFSQGNVSQGGRGATDCLCLIRLYDFERRCGVADKPARAPPNSSLAAGASIPSPTLHP